LGNGRTCRPRVRVSALALAIFSVISIGAVISAKADEDDLKKGTFIPTGVQITPSAASGSSFQALNPGLSFDPIFTVGQAVTTAISPSGTTLLILTSGYNSQNFTWGPNKGNTNPDESNEYILCSTFPAGSRYKYKSSKCPTLSTGLRLIQTEKSFTSAAGRTTTCTSTIGTEAPGPRAAFRQS